MAAGPGQARARVHGGRHPVGVAVAAQWVHVDVVAHGLRDETAQGFDGALAGRGGATGRERRDGRCRE